MEADDLLCSRNARPKKALVGHAQWKINQPPSLKRERASLGGSFISFDARNRGSTRLPCEGSIGLGGRAQWKINQPPSLERCRANLEGSSEVLPMRRFH
jgi:hypothetical protein